MLGAGRVADSIDESDTPEMPAACSDLRVGPDFLILGAPARSLKFVVPL